MPRNLKLVAVLAVAVVCALSQERAYRDDASAAASSCPHARRAVTFYISAVNGWRDRLDRRPLRVDSPRGVGCWSVRVRAAAWRRRSRQHRRMFDRWYEQTLAKWQCIHRHEGAWTDAGGPYYGGLQMDLAFQRAYGWDFLERLGTANNWPVWAQLVVAERAYRLRGWDPWPTARYC